MDWKWRSETIVSETVGSFQKVAFVPHALDRMKLRSITQEDVLTALRNPTIRGLPADVPHLRIAWKKTARKTLNVVYDEVGRDMLRVITVYWN